VSAIASPVPPGRRHDLDWIRVGAFMLLILYHVGMFYVSWDWHVKSTHEVAALEPVMMLTSPWRLTLLFLVSGCATRFLADGFAARGQTGWALAGSRTLRLLPPILLGMFVIVPPQSYYEIFEHLRGLGVADPAHSAALENFWLRYATASGNWCDGGECLITPTYNHLWFVVYLLIYSLLLAALLGVPGVGRGLQAAADRAFRGWGLVVWPLAWLLLIRWTLAPIFEINHALVADWYNHALSFSAFLFGYLTARSETVRLGLIRLRWPALAAAVLSWAAWAGYAWVYRADDALPPEALRAAMRAVYALDQWAFIVAILGFGARWLNHGGPVLRYLSIGVFPFYIAHQTVTVVAGHHLAKLGLPVAVEAGLLIAATAAGCLVTYEVARRIGWLGLFLGVKPQTRSSAAGVQAANRPPLAA
jgi:hypothetical protein